MSRLAAMLGVLAALAVAGCGDDDETTTPAADAEPAEEVATGDAQDAEKPDKSDTPAESTAAGTEIKLASSDFGEILFDGSDQAIYLFDKETSSTPDCYGECAAAWPPVLTEGEPQAGPGADAKLLGTTERDDGSTQVTYNGHPLYYYAHEGPGEVLCHGVDEFGGLWLVVDAAGDALPA